MTNGVPEHGHNHLSLRKLQNENKKLIKKTKMDESLLHDIVVVSVKVIPVFIIYDLPDLPLMHIK